MNQREHKYRAWYGEIMFESVITEDEGWVFIAIDDLNKPPEDQLWYNSSIIFADPKAIKLQYTGLKDRKGKEVYEGDIIQLYYKSDMTTINDKGKKKGDPFIKVCIHWEHFEWHTSAKMAGLYESLYEIQDCDFEVIGNIHKTPYLFTGNMKS